MLECDVLWEYRQIQSFEYEKKHGKPMPRMIYDDSFDEYLDSIGVTKEAIAAAKDGR